MLKMIPKQQKSPGDNEGVKSEVKLCFPDENIAACDLGHSLLTLYPLQRILGAHSVQELDPRSIQFPQPFISYQHNDDLATDD